MLFTPTAMLFEKDAPGCRSVMGLFPVARKAWFGWPVSRTVALSPTTTPASLIAHPCADLQLFGSSVPRFVPPLTVLVLVVRKTEFENTKKHAAVFATWASPVTCPEKLMPVPKLLDVPSNVPRSVSASGAKFVLDRK